MGKDLPSISVESFEYFPGRGLIATLHGIKVVFASISGCFSDLWFHSSSSVEFLRFLPLATKFLFFLQLFYHHIF